MQQENTSMVKSSDSTFPVDRRFKLYRFSQNNSSGIFKEDEDLSREVYIEAINPTQANAIAETIGIYFDGCQSKIDCDCCGDRWYRASEYDAINIDIIGLEKESREWNKQFDNWDEYFFYIANNASFFINRVVIHLLDGSKIEYKSNKV